MAPGTRVLVVDDDADIRDGLSEFLSDEGFEVATASNGRAAMEWLHVHRPESCVILLDLMMPVMDGRTFLRAKQSEPGLSTLPVVIITAGRTDLDETPDIRGCISKPLDLPRLVDALAACVLSPTSTEEVRDTPASGMSQTRQSTLRPNDACAHKGTLTS